MSNPLVINIYKSLNSFDGTDDTDSAICSIYYHWDADVSCAMDRINSLIEIIENLTEPEEIIKSIIDNTDVKFGCTEDSREEERELFLEKYGISFTYDKNECDRTCGLLYFSNSGKRTSLEYAISVAQIFLEEKLVNVDGCVWPSDDNDMLGDISFNFLKTITNK